MTITQTTRYVCDRCHEYVLTEHRPAHWSIMQLADWNKELTEAHFCKACTNALNQFIEG